MKNTFTELHFHTAETSRCADVSVLDSLPRYKNYGYDAVVITDHYTRNYFSEYHNGKISWQDAVNVWLRGYNTAKKLGDKIGINVLLGAEINFDCCSNDYLIYGLTQKFLLDHPCMYTFNEEEFIDFAKKHHLFFAQAHPFRPHYERCNPSYLMGVEVFNAHPHHNSQNDLAAEFCRNNNLIPICGSDFHHSDGLTGCGVNFHCSIINESELVDALLAQNYDMVIPKDYKYTPKI